MTEANNNNVKELFEKLFTTPFEKTEDDENNGFEQSACPYNICDGSGNIIEVVNGYRAAKNCRCYEDEMMRRRLRNANMDESLFDKELKLQGLNGVVFHPLANPPERELKKGKNNQTLKTQEPETPMEFIDRNYQKIEMKNGLETFVHKYINATLGYINAVPIEKVKNLMFLGDTGRGKTFMMNMIGKTYIVNGKKVYFTTMRTLVKDVTNKEKNIEKIVADVDLLLIDELGYEYHTDTGWAITQIKELLRVRYNKKLPVVCTTNLYPNEIAELYDKSLMSLFHGTYFMVYVDREEGDYRIQQATESLDDFADALNISNMEG